MKRKMLLFFVMFISLVVCWFGKMPAEPSVVELKNVTTILKPEYQHLSPAHGALWFKSPVIESMYRFGFQDEAPIRLLKQLFFLNNDQVNFNVMQSPTELATYLTPYDLGMLVGLIDKGGDEKKITSDIEKVINDALLKTQEAFDKEIQEMEKEIAPLLRDQQDIQQRLNALAKEKNPLSKKLHDFKSLQSGEQEEVKSLQDQLNKIAQVIGGLQKQKHEIDKKIQEQRKPLDGLNQKKSRVLKNFLQVLNETFKASDGKKYFKDTAYNMLLACTWAKAYNKEDLNAYFKGLSAVLGKGIFAGEITWDEWVKDVYIEDDYKKLKDDFKEIKEVKVIELLNNPDEAVFRYFGYYLFESPIPQKIRYRNDASYEEIRFPDCGETSLLNFFDVVLYDPKNKVLDGKKISVIKNEKLQTFFKQYSNPAYHDLPEVHNAWATLVSGLEGVVYNNKGVCEISSSKDGVKGLANMKKAFNLLTGFEIDNFVRQITGKDLKEEVDEKAKLASLTFEVNELSFKWLFKAGHFDMQFPPEKRFFDVEHFYHYLKEKKDNLRNNQSLIIWLSLYIKDRIDKMEEDGEDEEKEEKKDMKEQKEESNVPLYTLKTIQKDFTFNPDRPCFYHFLFGLRLSDYDTRFTVIRNFFKDKKKLTKDDDLFILSLYKALPQNDFLAQIEMAEAVLIESDNECGKTFLMKHLKEMSELMIAGILIVSLTEDIAEINDEDINFFVKKIKIPRIDPNVVQFREAQNYLTGVVANVLNLINKNVIKDEDSEKRFSEFAKNCFDVISENDALISNMIWQKCVGIFRDRILEVLPQKMNALQKKHKEEKDPEKLLQLENGIVALVHQVYEIGLQISIPENFKVWGREMLKKVKDMEFKISDFKKIEAFYGAEVKAAEQ